MESTASCMKLVALFVFVGTILIGIMAYLSMST